MLWFGIGVYQRKLMQYQLVQPSLVEAKGLLDRANLPSQDLHESLLKHFFAIKIDDELCAMAGLELLGPDGLLRSVVTADSCRSKGLATDLVKRIESHAKSQQLKNLYLITIDAQGYFQRHGYQIVERPDVPLNIQQSREYAELCPDDAIVMRKQL